MMNYGRDKIYKCNCKKEYIYDPCSGFAYNSLRTFPQVVIQGYSTCMVRSILPLSRFFLIKKNLLNNNYQG